MPWMTLASSFWGITQAAEAQSAAPRLKLVEELRLDATAEDFPTVSRLFVGPAFDAQRFAELTAPIPTRQDSTFNITGC